MGFPTIIIGVFKAFSNFTILFKKSNSPAKLIALLLGQGEQRGIFVSDKPTELVQRCSKVGRAGTEPNFSNVLSLTLVNAEIQTS